MAEHPHHHDHHHHHPAPGNALRTAAALTIAFAIVEALGGWWTGSLALLSDAGHMLTDGAALGLGAIAAWMARRPPSERHSYGLGRAEIVAALVNAGAMLVIVLGLGYEAVVRLKSPSAVNGGAAALIASSCLAIPPTTFGSRAARHTAAHRRRTNPLVEPLHVPGVVLRVDRPDGAAAGNRDVIDVRARPRDPPVVQNNYDPVVLDLLEILTE